ncbi:OAM dimerization domain-containing protein [Fusibacter bizertensis]|jgi:Predicted cobalamin binding protein|uniref:OAM dimerization domain-containing protein n=1 Tax=Fusibacter bizertensis TaxID=1488331 RepID=A0ABT6NFR9_9FIRM|nr:OAM dimerization domain-containing protein [Fusibacter bizertensis]MDH8679232.1 OAM dimerization domain-containing protein [Fusibacter bizertensis]
MQVENGLDLTKVKPYGDTMNDGMMQFSFTLPIPLCEESKEAAKQLLIKMGIEEPQVVSAQDLGVGYTFFIMYGKAAHTVDYTQIEVPKVDSDVMDKAAVEAYIEENFDRDIVIVGACTGTDAHTVGIDAIMNMKGYDHHYGLERYQGVKAHNLGAQVPNEELVAKAIELGADAIIVSQIVTQKDVHIPNMTQLIELLESEGIRDKVIVCAGGPRISYELAKELGYDAGFGTGTFAEDVASYIVQALVARNTK